jgi:hypothetical protein
MNKLLATTLVSVGLAAAVPAAFSQSAEPAAQPAAAPAAQTPQRFERRAFRAPSERIEARLAYLRTALKITSGQEAQWEAYANFHRKQAQAMDERLQERRARMEKARAQTERTRQRPGAIERHERQRERMVRATQRLDELLAVEKPLYAALSPEQQRVADEVLAPRGKGRGGFHHRGRFGRA